jgi:hypothetical protein
MNMTRVSRLKLLLAIASLLLLQAAGSGVPAASAAGEITLQAFSNSSVEPGEVLRTEVMLRNFSGSEPDGSQVTIKGVFPPTLIPEAASDIYNGNMTCEVVLQTVSCVVNQPMQTGLTQQVVIDSEVASGASGVQTATFTTEGGGFPDAETVHSVRIGATDDEFGFTAFDGLLGDGSGGAITAAGRHPSSFRTAFGFTSHTDPNPIIGFGAPAEDVKDIVVTLPVGLVGRTSALQQCTLGQLSNAESAASILSECPVASQIGTIDVQAPVLPGLARVPVYNMVPPPGVPARFGLNEYGAISVLDTQLVSTNGAYRLQVSSPNIPQPLGLTGIDLNLWGVPRDPSHDFQRACPGASWPMFGQHCAASGDALPLFRTPTSCTPAGSGLQLSAAADSWQHPGVFATDSVGTHEPPGLPYPEEEGPEGAMHRVWGAEVGINGCDQIPFEPSFSFDTTTDRADSPTGLAVDIDIPSDCWAPKPTVAEAENAICDSDLKKAEVTLPEGFSLNSAAGGGREGCSQAQMGITSQQGQLPVAFDEAPVSCPAASKIGEVEIISPLTDEKLEGFVYLAQQGKNPFGSLVAIYFVAEGAGVRIKQAGEISLDPRTGRITNTFDQAPQVPFSNLHLEFYGGPRATVRTPSACGTYTTDAAFGPWSGTATVQRQSSFRITQGCGGGFDPKLSAGAENPLAAATSPFNLRITREDGTQELGGLSLTMPPGLSGYLKGIPYCPDSTLAAISDAPGTGRAQEAGPSCPKASEVGKVTVGAGAGPNPFYTSSSRAYLAGPYKGAPLSLAVVAPAVAGPFDLGSVVVRNALRIDPETAQITAVSDPLPTILHGIPLDLRDVRVSLDRDHFTLNPSNCDPLSVGGTISSAQGQSVERSNHFQVSGCDRLGFKPRLSLKLKGGTRRSDHPALTAVLRPRSGDANLARVQVALPHSEFLAQDHIKTICTRVQFAADQCPKGSIYGRVTATSPIVDYPLTGNVYLRSSSNPLPDMVLALRGPANQPIEIDAVGRIDSKNGGIRTTFTTVPDQPLTQVVLRMPAGKKSLLENSQNICRAKQLATVQMSGQNGRRSDSQVLLRAKCPKKGHGGHKGQDR